MLPLYKIDCVRELLKRKCFSLREIARRSGVSRAKVAKIAAGRRSDRPHREPRPDDDFEIPAGPPKRCPECGGTVYLPCRACRIRKLLCVEAPRRQTAPPSIYVVGLDLKPHHRLRYERIRRRKEKRRRGSGSESAVPCEAGAFPYMIIDVRRDDDCFSLRRFRAKKRPGVHLIS